MKPAAFQYLRVDSVEAAIKALSGADAKLIAGGQSLVPMMNFRLVQPEVLVDINAVPGLSEIEETGEGLKIGALVRHAEALSSDVAARRFPIIAEAMRHVAHLAIRNRGTIGGSLVHADPSAEWALLVTLFDGEIEIAGPDGVRLVGAQDFFIAALMTSLAEDEIVTSVRLKYPGAHAGMAFDEVAQRAGDFAIVSAGACLRLEEGRIAEVRLALGGVGDAPVRARAAEAFLLSKPADADMLAEAARLAADGLEPQSDLQAPAEYRLHLVPVMAGRVLARAAERAKDGAA